MLSRDLPNLVRMDCSLLAGLAAEKLTHLTALRKDAEPDSRLLLQLRNGERRRPPSSSPAATPRKPRISTAITPFTASPWARSRSTAREFFRERFGETDARAPNRSRSTTWLPSSRRCARKDVAAFVVEPVQGKSCEVVADGYLEEAARLCRQVGCTAGGR